MNQGETKAKLAELLQPNSSGGVKPHATPTPSPTPKPSPQSRPQELPSDVDVQNSVSSDKSAGEEKEGSNPSRKMARAQSRRVALKVMNLKVRIPQKDRRKEEQVRAPKASRVPLGSARQGRWLR